MDIAKKKIFNFLKNFNLSENDILDPQDFNDLDEGIAFFNRLKNNKDFIYDIEDLDEDFINFKMMGLTGIFIGSKNAEGDIEVIQWDTPEPETFGNFEPSLISVVRY